MWNGPTDVWNKLQNYINNIKNIQNKTLCATNPYKNGISRYYCLTSTLWGDDTTPGGRGSIAAPFFCSYKAQQ